MFFKKYINIHRSKKAHSFVHMKAKNLMKSKNVSQDFFYYYSIFLNRQMMIDFKRI